MLRRLTLATVFLVVGFVAGPGADRTHAHGRRSRGRGRRRGPPSQAKPRPHRAHGRAGGSWHAGPDERGTVGHPQRAQHLVDVGRPHAELAVRQRPVLQGFLRPRQPLRVSRPAPAEPRIGRRRLGGRLRPHQQPRHRRRALRGLGHAVRQTRDAREDRRRRRGDGPRRPEDRRAEPAGARLGRLVEIEGGRVGAGRRQSVRRPQSDRHARHRQRHGAQPRRA